MGLVFPDSGLLFWMLITFIVVFIILKKYAWKPIISSLHERERKIKESLLALERAQKQIEEIQEQNKKLLQEAKEERDKILQEAREYKEEVFKTAEKEAKEKAAKLIADAKIQIESEKQKAIFEIKNTIAEFSIMISEKILQRELEDKEKHKDLIDDMLKNIKQN